MPTAAEIAAQLEQAAQALHDEGKHEQAAALALAACKAWRAVAGIERADRLTGGKYSPTLKAAMDVEHRAAISKGRASRKAGGLLKAAQAKGIRTMKELAEKLEVSTAFLSMAVNGKKKMPTDLAERIRTLTGWEP